MHIRLKQKLCIYIFMVFLLILMDLITSLVICHSFFIKYPLLEISGILIILAPIFLIESNYYSVIYSSIIFIALDIIMGINLTLNYASNDVFSIKYIFMFSEAAQVMNSQFVNYWYIVLCLILAGIYFTYLGLIYRLFKYHFKVEDKNIKRKYYPLAESLMVLIIAIGAVGRIVGLNDVKKDNSDSAIYDGLSGMEIIEAESNTLKRGAIENYGMITYLGAEMSVFITNDERKELEDYFDSGRIVNEEITDSLSGVCKDMNVITIMIETGVDFTINKELTPNLYMLKNDGIDFTNNYSKNKTNISEIIGIVGSVAKTGMTNTYNIKSSMPNTLKDYGYDSYYFHNNSSNFYNRNKLNKSMGFSDLYFKTDIDPEQTHDFIKGDYPLDSYFMNGLKSGNMNVLSDRLSDIDGIVNKIVPEGDNKFYSFWTTMSTHGPYNTSERNMKYYEDLGYVERIKKAERKGLWTNICNDDNENIKNQIISLECEMMDLDLAIGTLIKRLKDTNKLDNTLLVLYGDHEPYYMCNDEKPLKFAIYNTDNPFDSNLFNTTLIMYNKKLNQKYEEIYGNTAYDKFSSPYNIVPTTLDLLGVKYNENHYVAKSAFLVDNELENVFYSHELQSLFTNKLYSYDLSSYAYKSVDVDDTYIADFNKEAKIVSYKIKLFNRFYEHKLFEYMK